jgi:hypothetical protein
LGTKCSKPPFRLREIRVGRFQGTGTTDGESYPDGVDVYVSVSRTFLFLEFSERFGGIAVVEGWGSRGKGEDTRDFGFVVRGT